MKEIKIAFFDIDGTLIDLDRKEISEKMLETLTRLKRRGIILCPATGRAPMTLPHFGEIEFDAFLTFNCSYCFNSEQTIFSNPLASEDVSGRLKMRVRSADRYLSRQRTGWRRMEPTGI